MPIIMEIYTIFYEPMDPLDDQMIAFYVDNLENPPLPLLVSFQTPISI